MRRKPLARRKKALLLVLAVLALLAALGFRAFSSLNGTLVRMAEARARQLVADELNGALQYVLDTSLSYQDFVTVTLDASGRVNMLSANAILMDRLATDAVAHAQAQLRALGEHGVEIPLGSALGGGLFSGAGPRLRFSIVPVGTAAANFVTEFESAGINQTRHKISLEASATVKIVVPSGTEPITVHASIPVAETILVGDVPDSYIQVPSASDTLNFLP